jgi:hypothetical protein
MQMVSFVSARLPSHTELGIYRAIPPFEPWPIMRLEGDAMAEHRTHAGYFQMVAAMLDYVSVRGYQSWPQRGWDDYERVVTEHVSIAREFHRNVRVWLCPYLPKSEALPLDEWVRQLSLVQSLGCDAMIWLPREGFPAEHHAAAVRYIQGDAA